MPSLPVVSGGEVVKALQYLGFVVMRRRGSHIILRNGSRVCVVPNHQELDVGTLRGLLKQAEVSIREFLDALNI